MRPACRCRVSGRRSGRLWFQSSWLLLPFPACSFFSVLEDDAGVEQLLPDLIGPLEVAALLGLSSLGAQAFYVRIGNARLFRRCAQNIENSIELSQQHHCRPRVSGTKFTSIP